MRMIKRMTQEAKPCKETYDASDLLRWEVGGTERRVGRGPVCGLGIRNILKS